MLSLGYKTVQVLVLSSTLRLFSRSVCLWDNEVEWGIYLIEDYGSTSFHQLKVNGNSSQIGLIIGQEPPSCKIVLMLRTRQDPVPAVPERRWVCCSPGGCLGEDLPGFQTLSISPHTHRLNVRSKPNWKANPNPPNLTQLWPWVNH